ncbi:peptide chain release factor N(5)-glutamine methyltransferase [Flavobacteriaceae bacterium F08102]|nr:peptide chain release factor N(5)-glutamine methyltransferase [Flavobacteriaceae bacterium F08102]
MKIKDYQQRFETELITLYAIEEIKSFFNLLTAHFFNLSRVDLALTPNLSITDTDIQRLNNALYRLKNHEPIQYIIGSTSFFGLPFKVNQNVLIPRPETEELVAWILNEYPSDQEIVILEIGTGSGCISISLAHHLPKAKIIAIDISESALNLAESNAKLNHVAVQFSLKDILNDQHFDNLKVDLIVSNPPYVRTMEQSEMQENVLAFEPHIALFVEDDDPLLFYRAILEVAKNTLQEHGKIFVEINQYLSNETAILFEEHGFNTTLRDDLNSNPRMIKAEQHPHP